MAYEFRHSTMVHFSRCPWMISVPECVCVCVCVWGGVGGGWVGFDDGAPGHPYVNLKVFRLSSYAFEILLLQI